jgi:hypothetical protein
MSPIQPGMETFHRLQRALKAMTGILIFLWVGVEDRSSAGLILGSSMIAFMLSINIGRRLRTTRMLGVTRCLLIYTLTGLIEARKQYLWQH